MMRVWNTGRAQAKENMAADAYLLKRLEIDKEPVLHLYDWTGDCATYGHFIKPEKLFHLDRVGARGLTLEKRPTGGGVIFHMTDLTFSLAVPMGHSLYFDNPLDCYSAVNARVLEAIHKFLGGRRQGRLLSDTPGRNGNFCMAHPTKYDVILDGKIGGAAQRRSRFGYLHQGSISVADPCYEEIEEVLLEGKKVTEDMKKNSQSLLGMSRGPRDLEEAKRELREILIKRLSLPL